MAKAGCAEARSAEGKGRPDRQGSVSMRRLRARTSLYADARAAFVAGGDEATM